MKRPSKDKRKIRTRFIVESIALFLIIISPFIFKLHEYFPRDPEATIQFLGIEIDSNGFFDLNTYAWFLLGKMVPLLLLFIWFLTCKHWWYHVILIPLLMYAFQIFEVFYNNDKFVDTKNLLWLLPVCMVVIPFVYFIRIKLYDKYVHGIDLEAMEAELNALKEKQAAANLKSSTGKLNDAEVETDSYLQIEKVDRKLSNENLESIFRQFQHQVSSWLNIRS
ncbi:hypothetical protein [Pareuzebyella sediminis]|uniref:hypothetical protein n=1 Tax=Pareuzebyella sediminis TaxID=2607998 RepID=UPI0011F04009|nr:hypothetical protein [Pareuzebyella sediminis]